MSTDHLSACCVVLVIFVFSNVTIGVSEHIPETNTEDNPSVNKPHYLSDFYRLYKECFANNVNKSYEQCLSTKVVILLDRVVRKPNIPITEGLALVENAESRRQGRDGGLLLTEDILEATLPRSLDQRQDVLYTMLTRRVAELMSTHSLQVKLPYAGELRGLKRLRLKKMILPFLVGVVLKAGAFLPVVLGVMGILALQSFAASKTALAITALIGLRKLFSSGNGGGNGGGGLHLQHHDHHHKPHHLHEMLAHSIPEFAGPSHEAFHHPHPHGYGRALSGDAPILTTHTPVLKTDAPDLSTYTPVIKRDIPVPTTDATTLPKPPKWDAFNYTQL